MMEPSYERHHYYMIDAQISCVQRELAMRKKVYPKWVMNGRMKAEEADYEINCMQAVHNTLSGLREMISALWYA